MTVNFTITKTRGPLRGITIRDQTVSFPSRRLALEWVRGVRENIKRGELNYTLDEYTITGGKRSAAKNGAGRTAKRARRGGRVTERNGRSPVVEGTKLSASRQWWPDGRMKAMPGDAVHRVVPGLYGAALLEGVAVKHGDSVKVRSQGKLLPASAAWSVAGDPEVARRESVESQRKASAKKSKAETIEQAKSAVLAHAKRLRVTPVRDVEVGQRVYRITSDGAYGDGDPDAIHVQEEIVSGVTPDGFEYENKYGSIVDSGTSGWWAR